MYEVTTTGAPGGSGPFSQAIVEDGKIYTAGQGGVDPETGEIVHGGIVPEAEQVVNNIEKILKAAGASLNDIIKVNIYLTNIEDYDELNKTYSEFFDDPYPARSVVEVSDLPIDIRIEVETVARLPE